MSETKKIIIKNKVNWLIALVLPVPITVLIVIILIIFPITIISNYNSSSFSNSLISIINYSVAFFIFPIAFLTVFLYLWLWNTLGKTILAVTKTEIRLSKKSKLFYKTKTYKISEIKKIYIENRDVETNGYSIRLNYLFSKSNQTIAIEYNDSKVRIFGWISKEEANKIIYDINTIVKIN